MKLKIIILIFTTWFLSSSVKAQPNTELLNFIVNITDIPLGSNLNNLLFSNSNRILTIEQYNRMILNLSTNQQDIDNGSYYWDYTGKRYDDGVKGKEYLSEYGNTFFAYVNGRVNLSPDYITLFVTCSNDLFMASAYLINYDLEGMMLSGIELFAMESYEPSTGFTSMVGENYHIITSAKIYTNGDISTLTLGDDIGKRIYVLDNTGHFEVVKEIVEDFPDNFNDEEIPFLN